MTQTASATSVPLRRRLLLLAAAGMIPVALMSGVALVALFEQQRAQAARTGLEVARALSLAIDGEVQRTMSALHVLANSPSLDAQDMEAFGRALARSLPLQPEWRAVILADGSGKVVAHAGVDATPPTLVERDSFERTLRERRPVVGFGALGPRGGWAVPLRVPVLREGEIRYVLTAALNVDSLLEIMRRQKFPDGWVATVIDGRGTRIARWPGNAQYLGTPASASLTQLLSGPASEGVGFSKTSEGTSVFTSYVRLPDAGWTVALGVPEAVVQAGARRSIAAYGTGILLSILIGVIAALYIARSINRPMARLRAAAQALGRGERAPAAATEIRELRDVADALEAASVERAQGEAEREQLLRREQSARAAAESANRAKDEFLAMLGHELRNPLGAISNAASLLQHPALDARRRGDALDIITRQVGHLTRLTDDLLDAGRAIMGKIVLQRRPLNLAQVAAQALATLKAAGRISRHHVIEDYRPVWVEADRIRVEQIISNLVINAAKYTPPGGRIEVRVRSELGNAVLTVADDGIGLEPDLAARVFDLFVQGDRDLDRALGGLGIGLTLVRRLAEMHGGTASVQSAGTDQGSEFRVSFPAVEPPDLTQPRPESLTKAVGRDILVVEDNPDARETLQHLLELSGHTVRVAGDGVAGLQAALTSRPDAALVDIGLPLMDGYEVARRIRASESGGDRMLLVAVTGYGLPEDRERALQAGFDAHMVKPVDAQALEEVLASATFRKDTA